jgi:hypothetical protein
MIYCWVYPLFRMTLYDPQMVDIVGWFLLIGFTTVNQSHKVRPPSYMLIYKSIHEN